jgi:hypothetical protein
MPQDETYAFGRLGASKILQCSIDPEAGRPAMIY